MNRKVSTPEMKEHQELRIWKIIGIISAAIVILCPALYLIKERNSRASLQEKAAKMQEVRFVGNEKCKDCHKPEYDRWKGSHHDLAMEVASEETVLGDFDNATFLHFGNTTRFYRRDGKFMVETQGPGGKTQEYEITHTFGWTPLQQYLVPFPGGRLQCLPIAWDVEKKKWYHLYPDEPLDPEDWLYWTNNGQNWNGMCAECHSTDLKKNYDPDKDIYNTTWSQIDVGCEACHGPGSEHTAWAELPEMARPETENFGLVVRTRNMSPRKQNELCAPCHSRRMSLGDNTHQNKEFLDYAAPQLLMEGFYFADGQILEEVYVYGSFMQSKMYHRDVKCGDCHDIHGAKRIKEGNQLCLQCHRADIYDTKSHHFHKQKDEKGEPILSGEGEILFEVGTGAECEQCHMPGRYYMGIDYRKDHSFRVPRPDLTTAIGVPNACNRCHVDKTTEWSSEYIAKWYGKKYKPHYGTVLEGGRRGKLEFYDDLARLAGDPLFPAIVRATALTLLGNYGSEMFAESLERALMDEEALVRWTALRNAEVLAPEIRLRLCAPLLYDSVKAVRIEAANALVGKLSESLDSPVRKKYVDVLEEYEQAMYHSADFATSRHNLGNLYAKLGRIEDAVGQYRKAVEIDDLFYPAKVNLAMLYNGEGNNQEAESLLRQVVKQFPDLFEVQYSLGLLLAEMKRFREAAEFLESASQGLPGRARIAYNLGLTLAYLNEFEKAESAFLKAQMLEPDNLDYLYALADFYLKIGKPGEAEKFARQILEKHPSWPYGTELLRTITDMQNRKAP